MEQVKTYFNNLISNSPIITISIVTCFGYLFAYQYEIGAAKYYNIPAYLVQIDLLQVILNAVLTYITVFFLGLLIYLIISNFHHSLSRLNLNQTIKMKSDIITARISAALLVLLLLIIIPNLLGQQWAGEKRSYFIFQKNDKNYAKEVWFYIGRDSEPDQIHTLHSSGGLLNADFRSLITLVNSTQYSKSWQVFH
jgi:hypothetical protein